LSGNWNLKAEFSRGKVKLLQIDSKGRLREKEVKISYPFYLAPVNRDAESLEQILRQFPFIRDAFIEDWYLPPWYIEKGKIVRAETDCLPCIGEVMKRLEGFAAERVNVQPSSKSMALARGNIPLFQWEGRDPWEIELDLPPVRVLYAAERKSKIILSSTVIHEDGEILEEEILLEDMPIEQLSDVSEDHHIAVVDGSRISCKLIKAPICLEFEKKGNPVDDVLGLMELARLSYTNLKETAERSIGHILTEIEALKAVERRMIVPPFRPRTEGWRTIEELLEADSGGLIGLPRPGVYKNAVQLDFSSLYPSIIARFNISPETVERPGCLHEISPPGSLHRICVDTAGLVSSVLEKLVRRRDELKARGSWKDSRREKALKWIMVASFGYLGYRNSRFGSTLAYESVISISKEIMRRAIATAKGQGYEVIHFIVDSLFVWKHGERIGDEEVLGLKKAIEGETGMKIKVEAIYRFLIFPRTATAGLGGAPNRYYGITREGRIIVKGVKCPGIETVSIPEGGEDPIIDLLLSNKHPRKLCSELFHFLQKRRPDLASLSPQPP